MLISAIRYTRGLDLEARVYAETTGIAMGWLESGGVFRCGCWVCEFVVEIKQDSLKPRVRAKAEEAVKKAFAAHVKNHQCLHWNKYRRYKATPNEEVALARQIIKRTDDRNVRLAKAEGPQQIVEDLPWELDARADDIEDLPEAALEEILESNEPLVRTEDFDTKEPTCQES